VGGPALRIQELSRPFSQRSETVFLTQHSYSGGRDGIVCAWDLHLDLEPGTAQNGADVRSGAAKSKETTQFRAQTIAHTHWINDIVLAQKHAALVSASSDLTVKVWRPLADSASEPVTVGQHADYVKCLATPAPGLEDWVASGGLDRKIYLWDLNGKGKSLEIDVKGEEITEKGSVYALTVNQQILACGGPESTVRLYDPKTGKRITKFVGHTDNIRSILMNAAGDTLITASSDQTVKVWSVTAGRCMQTLTMHNDSVWSLYSDDPDLGVFYSSDRSGLVVKTDVRGAEGEWDDGLCVALAHEHDGVSKIVASGGYLWTATASSSINRWADIDVGKQFHVPEPLQQKRAQHRASIVSTEFQEEPAVTAINGRATKDLPLSSILRISNTASFPLHADSNQDDSAPNPTGLSRKDSAILAEPFLQAAEPIHQLPEETIEGQFGLVKHRLLNDRRRVLTLDTSGDVLLWDLIQVGLPSSAACARNKPLLN
jgi:WD repeat-containing protein 48